MSCPAEALGLPPLLRVFAAALVISLSILRPVSVADEKAGERTEKINRVAKDIFNPLVSPEELNDEMREAVEVDFPPPGKGSTQPATSSSSRQSGGASGKDYTRRAVVRNTSETAELFRFRYTGADGRTGEETSRVAPNTVHTWEKLLPRNTRICIDVRGTSGQWENILTGQASRPQTDTFSVSYRPDRGQVASSSAAWDSHLPFRAAEPAFGEEKYTWVACGTTRVGVHLNVAGDTREPFRQYATVRIEAPRGEGCASVEAFWTGKDEDRHEVIASTVEGDKYLRVIPDNGYRCSFDGKYIYNNLCPEVRVLIGKPRYGEPCGGGAPYRGVNILELPFDVIGRSGERLRISTLAARPSPTAGEALIEWTSIGYPHDLRYSTGAITEQNWDDIGDNVYDEPPNPRGQLQHYTVTGLRSGVTYNFAVKCNGELSNVRSATIK